MKDVRFKIESNRFNKDLDIRSLFNKNKEESTIDYTIFIKHSVKMSGDIFNLFGFSVDPIFPNFITSSINRVIINKLKTVDYEKHQRCDKNKED